MFVLPFKNKERGTDCGVYITRVEINPESDLQMRNPFSYAARSHLYILKSRPARATQGNFSEMEWDLAILLQLQSLCRNYGVYVVIMGLSGCYWVALTFQQVSQ